MIPVWSPRKACVPRTPAPTRSRSRARIPCPSTVSAPPVEGPAELEALRSRRDLVAELHQPVEDALGTQRTARNVDVDRNDRVDALHRRVVVVEAAGARADSERHHPLR